MLKARFSGAFVLVLAFTLVFGANGAAQSLRLSIATGGTGGVYFPYGGALANLLSDDEKGLGDAEVTAEVTSASVDNMLLIDSGDADLAFVLADTAFDATQGNAPFETQINGQTIATLYNNYTQIVVKTGSNIHSLADLAGKRVSVGAPGSGTEVIANRVLQAAGIDPKSGISVEQLGVAESAGAMKDDKLDAFFWSGGLPTSAITDLAATPNMSIKLLPHGEIAAALRQTYGAFYSTAVIPANTYPNQTEDAEVVIVPNVLVVNGEMDAELAYNITRVMFEHQADLAAAHPEAQNLTLENATQNSPIPYHEGALRYYAEQGITPGEGTPAATPAT